MPGDYPTIETRELPSLSLEFLIPGLLNFIQLIALISRKSKLTTAGHSYHTNFPYSIKVKMLFLALWATFVFSQIIFMIISRPDYNCWVM